MKERQIQHRLSSNSYLVTFTNYLSTSTLLSSRTEAKKCTHRIRSLKFSRKWLWHNNLKYTNFWRVCLLWLYQSADNCLHGLKTLIGKWCEAWECFTKLLEFPVLNVNSLLSFSHRPSHWLLPWRRLIHEAVVICPLISETLKFASSTQMVLGINKHCLSICCQYAALY